MAIIDRFLDIIPDFFLGQISIKNFWISNKTFVRSWPIGSRLEVGSPMLERLRQKWTVFKLNLKG